MAKLAILAGVLVALLAVADATTVTTTLIEENRPSRRQGGQMEMCRDEIAGRQFKQCQMYLTMGQMRGGRRGGRSHNDAIAENPQQEQYMWECCEEMSNVMPMCRCEAIQEAVNMAMYGPQGQGQGKAGMEQMMMRTAMNLPRMCQWSQPTMCDMRPMFV